MSDSINRHGTSAWLENMGHPNLAKMIMDEKRFPSVQPEIIRCKDCKYWKRSSCCEGYCGEIDMEGFDEDHYCGFAERREE